MSNKRGRPRGVTASEDMLALICLLKKLQWSDRRIAKLFHRDHTTISDWYNEAYEKIGDNFSTILTKSRRGIKEIIQGGRSDEVAWLYAKVHENLCGGGKWVKQHRYNGNYGDEQKDYTDE